MERLTPAILIDSWVNRADPPGLDEVLARCNTLREREQERVEDYAAAVRYYRVGRNMGDWRTTHPDLTDDERAMMADPRLYAWTRAAQRLIAEDQSGLAATILAPIIQEPERRRLEAELRAIPASHRSLERRQAGIERRLSELQRL